MKRQTKIVLEDKFLSDNSKERQEKLNEILIKIILKSKLILTI